MDDLENRVSNAPLLVQQTSDRVPTGITGLDDLIEGGFPRGSLILLAGSPGSGKTVASAQYIYHGACDFGETGVYLSFEERESVFIKNMEKLGMNFSQLKDTDKFKFLDMMMPGNKAHSVETLNLTLKTIQSMKTQRLVIDSFTAMSLALDNKAESRIFLYLLEKVMRDIGCTTLLLVEVPKGQHGLGCGFEEFVVDGIILFETIRVRSGIRKRAIIQKMRGTSHNQNYCDIVISAQGLSLMPYVT
jgi:circadian clock protein KaiC